MSRRRICSVIRLASSTRLSSQSRVLVSDPWTLRFASKIASDASADKQGSSGDGLDDFHSELAKFIKPNAPPLPEGPMARVGAPPRVTGYPTPHVTDTDLKVYLQPLYSRGWGITVFADLLHSPPRPISRLSRAFRLKDFPTALKFVEDIAKIVKSENHHPILKIQNNEVLLETNTHSGLPPPTSVANLMTKSPVPSLTLRDARFAILVENLFNDVYIPDGRGDSNPSPPRPLRQRPSSLEELKAATQQAMRTSVRPRSKQWSAQTTKPRAPPPKCPCCAGSHPLGMCSMRYGNPPPRPCNRCGERHWYVDCPTLTIPKLLPIPGPPSKSHTATPLPGISSMAGT